MKIEFSTLAHTYNGSQNVKGWWASRKYNGWGVLWDGGITRGKDASSVPWYYKGADKAGVTATGLWTLGRNSKPKVCHAPTFWLDKLPKDIPLQGELWRDDDLTFIKHTCARKTQSPENLERWKKVDFKLYNVKPYSFWFDYYKILDHRLENFTRSQPYFIRLNEAMKLYPHGDWVKQTPIRSKSDVDLWVAEAKRCGWEGLMFVNPMSEYEPWRSHNVLKWKPDFDAEATVIGYVDGKTGRCIGKVGALLVELKWDEKVTSFTGGSEKFIGKAIAFSISGWEYHEREWDWMRTNYPLGKEIKFGFKCLSTHGIPQSPNIYRS